MLWLLSSDVVPLTLLQRSTADADMKVPSVENPELADALLLGQNIATHASHTARNFFLVLTYTSPIQSPSLFPNPLLTFQAR